jgi:hypothetical protein
MNTRLVTLFLLICSVIICEESLSFQIVDLDKINSVSGGYMDLYESKEDSKVTHEVWLYTHADCDQISWTLGGQRHSELLSCGRTSGFMNLPPGIHYTVIEGCGKRIAAYLNVNEDLHLMITPSDLDAADSCPGNDYLNERNYFYADSNEGLTSASLITEL